MALLPQIIYHALIWRERKRARLASRERLRALGPAPLHLETGRRGERLAYWYLRRIGYTVVARNLRGRRRAGELDLVAWDGPVLAFVEVKTRRSCDAGRPESAVTSDQQRRIAAAAQLYIRSLKQKAVNYRFDIVSVTWDQTEGYQLRLVKGAFKG
ncbi:MAG TPA: YraN family protein [Terriglobia bacterium]|nr:YraN family protein [Terriglobia bacterium]